MGNLNISLKKNNESLKVFDEVYNCLNKNYTLRPNFRLGIKKNKIWNVAKQTDMYLNKILFKLSNLRNLVNNSIASETIENSEFKIDSNLSDFFIAKAPSSVKI
ncbi:hypothetical protein [Chryseobacterium sp.]|uniref:hypothetical protein n=1 Tax=Chryseobacterium sp. TaxID=1871047 RepID=UPI00321B3F8C